MRNLRLQFFVIIILIINTLSFAQDKSGNEEGRFFHKPGSHNPVEYNHLFSETNPDSVNLRFEIAQKACSESIKLKNWSEYIQALLNMGNVYTRQYKYELAMQTYLKALNISDSIQNPGCRANVIYEIGSIYLEMRNIESARHYFTEALTINRKLKDKKSVAHTLSSIALTYWLKGNLEKAHDFLFESLKMEQSINNKPGISRCYNNIGIVYHEKKQDDNALKYLQMALELSRQSNNLWSIAEALNNMGEAYISKQDYDKAKINLFEAQKIAKNINALVLLSDNYRYLSRMSKNLNNYKDAFEYYTAFSDLEDSLFNKNKYTIISELQASFEIEKKEQSIQLQKKQIEVLEGNKKIDRLQKTILVGVLFFILAIGMVFFNRQKKINHRNKLLLEKDQEIQAAQVLLMENERAEKERLALELLHKNKFLIDFGLYIAMKNNFLIYLKDELKKLARRNIENQELKDLFYQLSQNLRQNSELIGLQENVEKVNSDFLQKLYERFPDITENEKHLLVFLRLNFSSKEISNIKAISIKAVEMSRYRLRKKFNLDSNESLTQFIHRI